MADLSFLSNDELLALKAGDYSKLSNESLSRLRADAANDLPSLLAAAGARKGPATQPVMGRLKEAEETIVPQQPRSWMDAFGEAFSAVGAPAGASVPPMEAGMDVTQEEAAQVRAGETKGATEAFRKWFPDVITAPVGGTLKGAVKLAPMAKEMIIGGAKQGFASQYVRELITPPTQEEIENDPFLLGASKRIAESSVLTAVAGGLLSPVARYLPPLAEAVGELFSTGANKVKRAVSTLFFRPAFEERVLEVNARRARDYIEQATGVRVPMGVAEAVGAPDLVAAIKVPEGAELSTDALDLIKRRVIQETARLSGRYSGASADEIAEEIIGTLRQEAEGPLSSSVRKAVKDFTSTYRTKVDQAMAEVANEAAALVPETVATPTVLGNRGKELMRRGYQWFNRKDSAGFNKVRDIPEYPAAEGGIPTVNDWANEMDASAVQQFRGSADEASKLVDQFEREIELPESARETVGSLVFQPEGTSKFIQAIGNLASRQKLDAMRRARTLVGNSIGDDTILPGLGDLAKRKLYSAFTKDIDALIDGLPESGLKQALQSANKFHRENVDNYMGRDVWSAIAEFGKEGGAAPVEVMSRVTSKDGPTFLDRMVKAAGPSGPELERIIGQYLFNDVASKAVADPLAKQATVNAGKAVEVIDSFPAEIKNKFFPMLEQVKAIARREAALAKLPEAEKALSTGAIDPQLLDEALKNGSSEVQARLTAAIREQAQLKSKIRGSWLKAVVDADTLALTDQAVKNPRELVEGFISGAYKPEIVREGIDMLVRNRKTKLVQDLQFQFLDQLMSGAQTRTGINADLIAKGLAPATKQGMPGKLRATTEAVFGKNETDNLAAMFQKLADLDKAGTGITSATPLVEAMARGAGAMLAGNLPGVGPVGAANQAAWLSRTWARGRYAMAAHILTTPELREFATKPIGEMNRRSWRFLFESFARGVGDADSEPNEKPRKQS